MPRDWFANLRVDQPFTVHLKNGVRVDLPAVAEIITDPEDSTQIIREIVRRDRMPDRPDQHVVRDLHRPRRQPRRHRGQRRLHVCRGEFRQLDATELLTKSLGNRHLPVRNVICRRP